MSKARLNCLLSLLIRLVIVVLVIISFVMLYKLGGSTLFRYYTVLSNLLCGLVAFAEIPFEVLGLIKNKICLNKVMQIAKFTSTTLVTVTFLTVLFFLGPTLGFTKMADSGSLYMHFIIPPLAIIAYLILDKGEQKWWTLFIPLGLTIAYGIFYGVNVLFTKAFDDFYGFADNIALSAILMFAAVSLVSFGLFIANHFITKHTIQKVS